MCKFCKIDNCNCHPDHHVRPQTVNVTKVLKTGSKSQPGANGSAIHAGFTAPSSGVGRIGDFYIDLESTLFYGPKTVNGWPESAFSVKGDPFTYADFTPQQIEDLKVKGEPFRYSDFTAEQLAGLKGETGNTPRLRIDTVTKTWWVSYDNGTSWTDLAAVAQGPQGLRGPKGDGFKVDSAGLLSARPEEPVDLYVYFAVDESVFYMYTTAEGWSEVPSVASRDAEATLPLFDSERLGGYKYRSLVESEEGVMYVSLKDFNEDPLDNEESWRAIEIPEAPLQAIRVNGEIVAVDEFGVASIVIPPAPLQVIAVNGVDQSPDPTGRVNIEVVSEAEQTIVPGSTLPVSSAAVYAALQSLSRDNVVKLVMNDNGDPENRVISVSGLNADDEVITTTDEVAVGGGGGGGGDTSTTQIILNKISPNPTVKQGDEVTLEYYFDHRDKVTQDSTGLTGEAEITITAGATVRTFRQTLNANNYFRLFLTELLLVGTNNVRVRVTVDNGETVQVSTIQWRVQVITLRLSSNFNFASVVNVGTNIIVPFSLSGSGSKNLKLYVDGELKEERLLISSVSPGTFSIPTTGMSHGAHSIQLVAELVVTDSVTLKSNSIYFDAAVRNPSVNTPIITTRFDYNDGTIIEEGQRPYIATSQFAQFPIQYAGYNPTSAQNTIVVRLEGSEISSVFAPFEQKITYSKKSEQGESSGSIHLGLVTYTFGVRVAPSILDIVEPTDNIVFKLSALGRNNSDSNLTTWTDRGITTSFYGVQFSGDGWIDNALRLTNDARVEINYKALSVANAGSYLNGFTFQTKFKISGATDKDAALISCLDNMNIGFKITSEYASFVSGGNKEVLMQFAPDKEYDIAFVSMPAATPNSSPYEVMNADMLMLYINGAMSKAVKRGNADSIYQSVGGASNIILRGKDAILDIYTIRCYNNYLTSDQILDITMLDQSDVNDTIAMYNRNDVIDSEGDVTVDSLPDGTRIMIISGEVGGMPVLEYATMVNNKDVRYPVTEILHIVKGQDRSLNFLQIGGCMRLQGTSSLAYPVKNTRTYYRSATSGSTFADVYVGVDEQGSGGTKLEGVPKFSFKKANSKGKLPAPVNVWCQKADFAESSSSHNTGYAKLINDGLVDAGFLTPAQKYQSQHPYDIRTTVDGDPMYMFYRANPSDKPIFAGKYNMNNDKATEEVFGFRDTPYHALPGSFTECYEFLNNDYPMGMYLDDDFDTLDVDGKPKWTKVFESRYPDVQDEYEDGTRTKPLNLERIVKWVKSTQGNPAKFKAELGDYFDVEYLCAYFVLTQWFMNVDQMVKNAMLAIYYDHDKGKALGYYIFYDNDTILGVRNDGRLKYGWDINRQTIDPETGNYAYMGHDSVLWNNLESQFQTEIAAAYRRLRAVLTNERILNMFNVEQQGKFPERVFNIDSMIKYIKPASEGDDFLDSLQGPRVSHREWIVINRSDLKDAEYNTGQYTLTDIAWKGNSSPGATLRAKVNRLYYLDFRREAASLRREAVDVDDTFTVIYPDTANIGTIFHLYGGKFISELDMSEWGGFTDLNFPVLPYVEKLILGSQNITNSLSSLVIGNKFPLLQVLDVTNFVGLTSLDLSGSFKLKELYAEGCSSLGTINLPIGAPIELLVLPTNLTTLALRGLPLLDNDGIQFPDGQSIQNLIVESCPNIDWGALLLQLGSVVNIRVTGINEEGNKARLDAFYNLGGLDSAGNIVSTPRLNGVYHLTEFIEDSVLQDYRARFPELTINQAPYTVYTIYSIPSVSRSDVFYNGDNGTGYDPELVVQNKPYVFSGHLMGLHQRTHRYLGKHSEQGKLSLIKLNDSDARKFAVDGTEAPLDGSQGDVWTVIPGYWYKGINNLLTNSQHFAVSINETAPISSAPYLKLVSSDSDMAGVGQYASDITGSISDAIQNSSYANFFRFKISGRGFNKIRVPVLPYDTAVPNLAVIFAKEDGTITKSFKYSKEDAVPGETLITTIDDAEWVYINYDPQLGFQGLVLSNSEKPEDFEPDWIWCPPLVTFSMMPTVVGSKLRSLPVFVTGAPQYNHTSVETFKVMASDRGFSTMGYDRFRNLSVLALFKQGTFNVKSKIGTTSIWATVNDVETFRNTIGASIKYGMIESSKAVGAAFNINRYLYLDPITGSASTENTSHICTWGIEDAFFSRYIAGQGFQTAQNPNSLNRFFVAQRANGSSSLPIPYHYPTITARRVTRLNFGKYADILSGSIKGNGDALTYTGSYYTSQYGSMQLNNPGTYLDMVSSSHNQDGSTTNGIVSFGEGWGNNTNDNISSNKYCLPIPVWTLDFEVLTSKAAYLAKPQIV